MKKKSTSQSAFFNFRVLIAALFCVAGIAVALLSMGAFSSASAQTRGARTNQDAPGTQRPDVVRMIGPVRLDQDLRTLPYVAPKPEHEEQPLMRHPRPKNPPQTSAITGLPHVQSLLENVWRPAPTMPPPILTFDGHNNTCGCVPPDSDGDVGPNHYVEAVNESIKMFDKSGNTLLGPTTWNSFFSGLTGTPCQNANDGDGFVLYDPIADRWLISDFAFPSGSGPFYQCIGISQTPNPVSGGWFLYALQVDPANPTFLGDYPKFAMWNSGGNPAQNAYFLTVNLFVGFGPFAGVRVFALDRASMLAGGPTNAIGFTLSTSDVGLSYSFLAANFRNGDPPPAGRNGMVLAINSSANAGDTETQVHARFFHVDFVNPANATFGVGATHQPNAEITVNGFSNAVGPGFNSDIVPQQGTTIKLDTVGDRMFTPVVYQNRGGTESLWASYPVILNYPNGPVAVRWYQFNVTGGVFPATPAQQQDWSNGNDGLWRWMPSIAVNQNGDVAIGYSTSSASIFPGIRYAGRLVSDPPNNLGQGEAIMFPGTASQTGASRWGDYSMTTADPADGISFWHVNEYATPPWRTRIGKFQMTAPLTLTSAVSRRVHGGAGTFDISLPGVECRSGDPTIAVIFTNNVVSGTAAVTSGVGTVSGTSFSGNTMTINLTGVANAQRLVVTLNNVMDTFGQTLPQTSVILSVLLGDTNGNGLVNAADVAQTKAAIGHTVTASNFRNDVNANGAIDAADAAIVKQHSGQSLPPGD
jgi:hypothetical protein